MSSGRKLLLRSAGKGAQGSFGVRLYFRAVGLLEDLLVILAILGSLFPLQYVPGIGLTFILSEGGD